jgi:hypothetical protein
VLNQNRKRRFFDSVARGVEAEEAVFIRHVSLVSLTLAPFWSGERERLERSLGFLLPGESEGFA